MLQIVCVLDDEERNTMMRRGKQWQEGQRWRNGMAGKGSAGSSMLAGLATGRGRRRCVVALAGIEFKGVLVLLHHVAALCPAGLCFVL